MWKEEFKENNHGYRKERKHFNQGYFKHNQGIFLLGI
jgi:hypothetical protein